MQKPTRYVSVRDIVIPAGTVFECIDGSKREFVSGNYEAILGLSKDSSGSLVYGIDADCAACMVWFVAQDC